MKGYGLSVTNDPGEMCGLGPDLLSVESRCLKCPRTVSDDSENIILTPAFRDVTEWVSVGRPFAVSVRRPTQSGWVLSVT